MIAKVVVDATLSPKIAEALVERGLDAVHVVDIGIVSVSPTNLRVRALPVTPR